MADVLSSRLTDEERERLAAARDLMPALKLVAEAEGSGELVMLLIEGMSRLFAIIDKLQADD